MNTKHIFDKLHTHTSKKELYKAYKLFFNTFASEQRIKILNLLRKNMMNVSEIAKESKMSQTNASHNIKRLMTCGFINQRAKGKYRYYELNEKTIRPMLKLIDAHMSEHCLLIIKSLGGKNE